MKKVFAPHLNRHVTIGGMVAPDPAKVAKIPKLKTYRTVKGKALPAVAGAISFFAAAMGVITNIEGNGDYGDCVEAEEAHFIAVETGNAGDLFSYTPAMTLQMYTALTGFNANNPATDQGTDPTQCLQASLKDGFYADGSANLGYLMVDATNKEEVMYAIATFGNIKVWLSLPDSWINPFPSQNGFIWDVDTPDPENGHCVGGYGYIDTGAPPSDLEVLGVTNQGLVVATWGLIGTITWAALAKLCVPSAGGGLAVRVTKDWLASNGNSPTGLNLTQLVQDFDLLGGNLPIPAPPAPPPAPSPPTPPTPPPAPTPPAPPAPPPPPKPKPAVQFNIVEAMAQARFYGKTVTRIGKPSLVVTPDDATAKDWTFAPKK